MNEMRLKRFILSQNESSDNECTNNFIKVLKTRHFNRGECKIQQVYQYQSPVSRSDIIVHTNDFETDVSGDIELNGLNLGPAHKRLGEIGFDGQCSLGCNGASNDEIKLVVQGPEQPEDAGCPLSQLDCSPLWQMFPLSGYAGADCAFSGYVSLDEDEPPLRPEGEACLKNLITHSNLVLMLLALFVPFLLHTFCQFRLYNNILDLKSASSPPNRAHEHVGVLAHLTEFEHFFFLGTAMYVLIQLIGSFMTYSRHNLCLKHLWGVSVKNAVEDLTKHRDSSVRKLDKYFKSSSIDANILEIIKKNLLKSFDELSYRFRRPACVWDSVRAYRLRALVLPIWAPFFLYALLSLSVCTHIYYRRLKLSHRVPLGHFKIVSSLYWHAAANYEGFLWILLLFGLNVVCWLLLAFLNCRFFRFAAKTTLLLAGLLQSFTAELSTGIWEREVCFILRNL